MVNLNKLKMKERFLPIGTVVMLKGGKKRLMITGFCAVPETDLNKIFDYSGCLYPEGFLTSKQTALFNHEQIETVFAVGFSDIEEQSFKERLNKAIADGTLNLKNDKTEVIEENNN
jgi:hypothetical protein